MTEETQQELEPRTVFRFPCMLKLREAAPRNTRTQAQKQTHTTIEAQ